MNNNNNNKYKIEKIWDNIIYIKILKMYFWKFHY